MSELGKRAVQIALAHVGEKEATGHNDGPFVEMIQHWLEGPGEDWMAGQPWCAAFASWCIDQAAHDLNVKPEIPRSGSTTDLYAWCQRQGKLLAKPEPYCLGMVKGSGGTEGKTHHHTFMVEAIDGDHVLGVDGNWQDQVARTRHAIAECDFGIIC